MQQHKHNEGFGTLPTQVLTCSGAKGLSQPALIDHQRKDGLHRLHQASTPGAKFYQFYITGEQKKHEPTTRETNLPTTHDTQYYIYSQLSTSGS